MDASSSVPIHAIQCGFVVTVEASDRVEYREPVAGVAVFVMATSFWGEDRSCLPALSGSARSGGS